MVQKFIFRLLPAMIFLILAAAQSPARTQDFEIWLAQFRLEAKAAGISPLILDKALTGLQPLPRIIKQDRHQPESRKTLDQYLGILLTKRRIKVGTDKLREKNKFFQAIEKEYGVPGSILVALWGIESNFGTNTGKIPVIAALATLAHDQRRASFFRAELFAALKLADQKIITLDEMRGSWAGAMGQLQFLPSVLLRFKVDQNQDGRVPIWHDSPELFATAANYLAKSAWQAQKKWGYEVDASQIPNDIPLAQMTQYQPLSWWGEAGVKIISGGPPESSTSQARLLLPDGRHGRAFLVLKNFEAILTWNRSNLYALAVGLLSDQIYEK